MPFSIDETKGSTTLHDDLSSSHTTASITLKVLAQGMQAWQLCRDF
jgi:hypothetical protein